VCWCTSEAHKYKKRNHNDGHNDFLLNWDKGCKKHTAWKFTKNKLEKLVNSMKIDFYLPA